MRYFKYIAEQAFKTSATGERLFYIDGFWSRPYIIPDPDTERRLYRKLVSMLRFLLGGLIFGLILYPEVALEVARKPYWLVIFMAASWVIPRLVFARDLKRLQPAPFRLRPRSFYAQIAQRHSKTGLFFGFITSLLFVVSGIWISIIEADFVLGILIVGPFGLSTLAWGYALYLKLQIGE